jgi:hypothetical protein
MALNSTNKSSAHAANKEKMMYELNAQMNVERLKDMQRDAENERLARSVQNQEKNSVLRNALNLFKHNSDERKR